MKSKAKIVTIEEQYKFDSRSGIIANKMKLKAKILTVDDQWKFDTQLYIFYRFSPKTLTEPFEIIASAEGLEKNGVFLFFFFAINAFLNYW